jgi:hypothetical protein
MLWLMSATRSPSAEASSTAFTQMVCGWFACVKVSTSARLYGPFSLVDTSRLSPPDA